MARDADLPPLVCPPDGLPPLGVDRGTNTLKVLIGTGIAAAFLFVMLRLQERGLYHVRSLWRAELMIVGLWYVCIVIHEAGHAIAAHLRKFRLISIFAGPLFVTRSEHGWARLGLRRALFGGAVLAVPRQWDGEPRFRRDYGWFVAGGPALSLAAGLAMIATVSWIRDPQWLLPVTLGGVISITFGVMTLIPSRTGSGYTSDGQKLLDLRRPEAVYWSIFAVRVMLHTRRPRDWDPTLVAELRAGSEREGPEVIDATILLYHYALDTGDTAGAASLLQRAIDLTCGTARWPRTTVSMEVGLEAAFFEAAWRRDPAAAAQWLDRTPLSPTVGKRRQLMTEAFARAPEAIQKLVRNARRSPLTGAWLLSQATLEQLSSSSSD